MEKRCETALRTGSGAGRTARTAAFAATLAATAATTPAATMAATAPAALATAVLTLDPRATVTVGPGTTALEAAATATTIVATLRTVVAALAGRLRAAHGLRSLRSSPAEESLEPAEETTGLGLGRGGALGREGRPGGGTRGGRRGRTEIAIARTALAATLAGPAAITTALAGGRRDARRLTRRGGGRTRSIGAKHGPVLAPNARSRLPRRGVALPAGLRTLGLGRGQDRQLRLLRGSGRRCRNRRSDRSRSNLRLSGGHRLGRSDGLRSHRGRGWGGRDRLHRRGGDGSRRGATAATGAGAGAAGASVSAGENGFWYSR